MREKERGQTRKTSHFITLRARPDLDIVLTLSAHHGVSQNGKRLNYFHETETEQFILPVTIHHC